MAITIDEYEQIYKRCFNRAMGLAVSLLHDEDDARDAVQDVFLHLWETRKEISTPDAYIYRAVHNECLNRQTATTRKERFERLYPLEIGSADEGIAKRLEQLWQACESLLTPRERQVVSEVFAEGHSYKETAQRLDISVSSVNKHVVNALRTLRNHFNNMKS